MKVFFQFFTTLSFSNVDEDRRDSVAEMLFKSGQNIPQVAIFYYNESPKYFISTFPVSVMHFYLLILLKRLKYYIFA